MEEPAYGVLRGKLGRIKRSNVDPAWLAGELLAAKIIGTTDVQRATNAREIADERLGELVGVVMRNGTPDVFQAFVSILLKEDNVKWLGEELKGRALSDPCHLHTYARFVSFQSVFVYLEVIVHSYTADFIRAGSIWRKEIAPPLQSGPTGHYTSHSLYKMSAPLPTSLDSIPAE